MQSISTLITLGVSTLLAGCPADVTESMFGSSAGGASAGAGAGAGANAPAQPDAFDECSAAEASTPSDVSSLGQLGACAPAGIVLPCRVDSPEAACSAEPSADPGALNRCRNVSDCAVLDAVSAQAAAKLGERVSNIVRGCGLPYITGTNTDCSMIASSASACVMTETSAVLAPGLSADCSGCFTQALLCNLKCLAHCSIDAESPACVACMHVEGCRGLFYRCSGLEPVE